MLTSCSSSTLPRTASKSPQHSPSKAITAPADCVLATALYDNVAETGDELTFMKGDILTVLEKNYVGQVGWWLCSLRGKIGICPGNRLRLLGHVIRSPSSGPVPLHLQDSSPTKNLDKNFDTVDDAITLKGEMENNCYDIPHGHKGLLKSNSRDNCTYDVPSRLALYDVPKHQSPQQQRFKDNNEQQVYDIPTPVAIYDVPVSSFQKHVTSCPPSPLGRNELIGDLSPKQLYDVPRQVASTPSKNVSLIESVYDVPPQVTRDAPSSDQPLQHASPIPSSNWSIVSESSDSGESVRPLSGSELPLELNAAMDMLVKLQQDVQAAIHRLFALVKTSPPAYELKLNCLEVKRSLQECLDFAKGAIANSVRREDSAIYTRLNKLCRPLTDASSIVSDTCEAMEKHLWAITMDNGCQIHLDRLVACGRTVVEDVRQVACFIQGNSTLIFKRKCTERPVIVERPLPSPPIPPSQPETVIMENSGSWTTEDYDYVNLEPKESHQRNENDNQILSFYRKQLEHLCLHLNQTITMFLTTVENNQPPKVFVDHGKAVILIAHKLMFIGDSVHRHIFQEELKKSVQRISDELCETLKLMVQRVKMAALQFPSVVAVQHMVDSVVGVSQAANKLNKTVASFAK